MRVGILTGGGDCPGLNAVIRAIVRRGKQLGEHEFVGFRYGWAGVLEHEVVELTRESTAGILPRGGTILGTSRTNPLDGRAGGTAARHGHLRARAPRRARSRSAARTRSAWRCVSPRRVCRSWACRRRSTTTSAGTDVTFGFHTAVQIATDAIDRLHTTAESHNRVMVVEVMGRHAGWIATYAGIAGGADAILVPERPFDLEDVCARLRRRHASGITFSIVVVSEGAMPREGSAMTTGGAAGNRRVRARAPRRHRRRAGARDRVAHRL